MNLLDFEKFFVKYEIFWRILIELIIPVIIYSFYIICFRPRLYKQLIYELYGNNSDYKTEFIKRHSKFVNQEIFDYNNNKLITAKRLCRNVRNVNKYKEKVWIIVGDAGSGKSILSERLALCGVNYLKFNAKTLRERGVIYLRFTGMDVLNDLKSSLVDNINGHDKILILDAFDECKDMRNSKGKFILDELFKILRGNYVHYSRIIITTRLEPIEGGINALTNYYINKITRENVRVFRIMELNNKLIIKMYRSFGGSYYNNNNKQQCIACGRNLNRIREYLKAFTSETKDKTIFRIPLIICYADIIFKFINNENILSIDDLDVYKLLVDYWISYEYQNYSKQHNEIDVGYSEEKYIALARNFLDTIIDLMVQKDTLQLKLEDFDIFRDKNEYLGFHDLLTRHIMHQYKDGYYQFVHISFFEYLVATRLRTFNFIKKKNYLSKLIHVQSLYVKYELRVNYKNLHDIIRSIKCYKYQNITIAIISESINELVHLLNAENVTLVNNIYVNVNGIIEMFPLISRLEYRDFYIEEENFPEYIDEGYLDLSNQNLKELAGLEAFGFIKTLDIRNNSFTSINSVIDKYQIDNLYIFDNPVRDILSCSTSFNKIGLTINNSDELTSVITNDRFKIKVIEIVYNPEIYLMLFDYYEKGYSFIVNKCIDMQLLQEDLKRLDTYERISLLYAIYTFQRKTFYLADSTFQVGRCLLSELYLRDRMYTNIFDRDEITTYIKEIYKWSENPTYKEIEPFVKFWAGTCLIELGDNECSSIYLYSVYSKYKAYDDEYGYLAIRAGVSLCDALVNLKKYNECMCVINEIAGYQIMRCDYFQQPHLVLDVALIYQELGSYKLAESIYENYLNGVTSKNLDGKMEMCIKYDLCKCKKITKSKAEYIAFLIDVYLKMNKIFGKLHILTLTTGIDLFKAIKENKYKKFNDAFLHKDLLNRSIVLEQDLKEFSTKSRERRKSLFEKYCTFDTNKLKNVVKRIKSLENTGERFICADDDIVP